MKHEEIIIKRAKQEDLDFILHANKEIDKASFIKSSALVYNIQHDIFDKKYAVCFIAKKDGEYAGMILFSKVYWADRGEGIYVSQVFVEEKFRGQKVMKKLFKKALYHFKDTKFATCLVSDKNFRMIDCVNKFEREDMLSFVINKIDF